MAEALRADGAHNAFFEQIRLQLSQRPPAIGQTNPIGRLIGEAHDQLLLGRREAGGDTGGVQLLNRGESMLSKRMQIPINRVDMHRLRRRNFQWAQTQAVQPQSFGTTLLMAIGEFPAQLMEPAGFYGDRATHFH